MPSLSLSQALRSGGLTYTNPSPKPIPVPTPYYKPQPTLDLNKALKSGGLTLDKPVQKTTPTNIPKNITTGGGGGGGGGGNGINAGNYQQYALSNGLDVNSPQFDQYREAAKRQSNDSLQAALGVFNAQKEGIMGRIPGVQGALDVRLKGLDQGLQSYLDTATAEETKRLGSLGDEYSGIQDQYGRAERGTRATAKSLARQLRNQFASRGALDSTQYSDFAVDQSKEIAQTLGDTRREGSGKLTANLREQESTKDYYSKSRLQEQQRVQLAKESAKNETNQLIQGIIADANLSDAQKVEAVTEAKGRLENRMFELDSMEASYTQQAQKDAQDYAIKMAQLQNKGYSDSYTQAKGSSKALETMSAVLSKFTDESGNLAISTEGIKNIGRQVGFPEEELESLVAIFGGTNSRKDQGDNQPLF